MKRGVFLILLILSALRINAQHYYITFTGSGAASTVDSVKVENLSQCTGVSLSGSDTLLLFWEVGIDEHPYAGNDPIVVFPNPSPGYFSAVFETTGAGNVSVSLFDLAGNEVLLKEANMPAGHHTILVSGIPAGTWFLRVRSEEKVYEAKAVSYASGGGDPSLAFDQTAGEVSGGNLHRADGMNQPFGLKSLIYLQYNDGDTLKLTGRSGNYRTVSILVPYQTQLVTFPFTGCTDIDGNNYAVVQIGSQLWMQENLKVIHYRDGSEIPNVPDSATWASTTSGAWCDFHNLPVEGDSYGHLYNFYAVDDPRKLCPQGWHVPSNSEWNTLERFLDPTDDTVTLGGRGLVIGRILKEGCSTRWAFMDTTCGWNSAGFTALCANFRNATGAWSLAPNNDHDDGFWTSTSYNTGSAWYRSFRWCYGDIYSLFPMKRAGISVRCIKD
jgi:uncharacterized protein (TIGR02145 family)